MDENGVSGACCTTCRKLHRSQRLLGNSTSLNLLSSSSFLDDLETLTHLVSFRDFLRVLNYFLGLNEPPLRTSGVLRSLPSLRILLSLQNLLDFSELPSRWFVKTHKEMATQYLAWIEVRARKQGCRRIHFFLRLAGKVEVVEHSTVTSFTMS